jgi:hypothetical protein
LPPSSLSNERSLVAEVQHFFGTEEDLVNFDIKTKFKGKKALVEARVNEKEKFGDTCFGGSKTCAEKSTMGGGSAVKSFQNSSKQSSHLVIPRFTIDRETDGDKLELV